jgi:hypothetical protein
MADRADWHPSDDLTHLADEDAEAKDGLAEAASLRRHRIIHLIMDAMDASAGGDLSDRAWNDLAEAVIRASNE